MDKYNLKGSIVKNLVKDKIVEILDIKKMGTKKISIKYFESDNKTINNKIIDILDLENLTIIKDKDSNSFKGDPEKFKLYIEAERIKSAYQFDPLFAVNCSIVDPLPHQIEAVYRYLLPLPKIRFLVADDTGAGKTIMTGLLLKELLMRDLIKRVLIITPGGLTKQWQEDEMEMKFNLRFKLVNRAIFKSDPNVFQRSNMVITSIDFIRAEDVLNSVKNSFWDIVIVDEAHKLSAFEYGAKKYVSKRYKAIEIISKITEHLILLTATPHRGRKDTFRKLLQLLDEDIFTTDEIVNKRIVDLNGDNNRYFLRRLKEDMKSWDGKPLFKERYTKTVKYYLTEDEKKLYDNVTKYIKDQKNAIKSSNIHLELTLMVMQRRLTSSIFAIKNTLTNRFKALNGLLKDLSKNGDFLLNKKDKIDLDFNIDNLDDYDELTDDEKSIIEKIFSDPKKMRFFTTANTVKDLKDEKDKVYTLMKLAEDLYNSETKERKLIKLKELLSENGVLNKDEKLVIFTEHKDTLFYLDKVLTNIGYETVVIHGGKSVDERREAQLKFNNSAQILIATDAAGEGINLQFCRLLINWDIPWNPNRLEQRMGRIHRYGQKQEVIVFNMVAANTREGKVLEKLLTKLDIIREQIGNDKVYDVISDIFSGTDLKDIFSSIFPSLDSEDDNYSDLIDKKFTKDNFQKRIDQQKKELKSSYIDYKFAKDLKDRSDEKRLQPIYMKKFFEKSFEILDGRYDKINDELYKIKNIPTSIINKIKEIYNVNIDLKELYFSFDKNDFLNSKKKINRGVIHYLNPGYPIFDSLIKVVLSKFQEDMMMGTVLISPKYSYKYFAFFVKSEITNDKNKVVDEKLYMVYYDFKNYYITSAAGFIDLYPPNQFAKEVDVVEFTDLDKLISWCFENITEPQYNRFKESFDKDIKKREDYIKEGFKDLTFNVVKKINKLYKNGFKKSKKDISKIDELNKELQELKDRREERLKQINLLSNINMKEPEIIGISYIIPLSEVEYKKSFKMKRDDETEKIAMDIAISYEKDNNRSVEDISLENLGYDLRSTDKDNIKRYIEVKGRAGVGGVMISQNEMYRLSQLGDSAWLYVVLNCKTKPKLYKFKNPAKSLNYQILHKGVQYFISDKEILER